ncbi:DctP family TRAP transporter solute-binding subunit [Acuticoccus sp. M5D2P5]|uniref:TRAP transporter substrate-binding protein n=1 Tax=Acuticoccus kalidii TaxID=2910977 RepID=UPI001F450CA0|nr:DctP family TRAP transporter solute-binding subunit [Acuticoccus kalidii]MCF3934601.1 DctP family TRAP transporter solute-binding subunit [Acuticoccus kalidii]
MINRRNLMAGAAIVGALAMSDMPAFAQDVTLRFGHYAHTADTAHKAAEHFAELVSQKTDGSLAIEVFPAGELGNSPTMLEGARLGTIDIVLTGNPYFTGFAPALNLLDLPFLFENDAHAYAVLDGEVGQALMDQINSAGLQGLAFWELGFRSLTNNVRPVREPADLEGLKIRTTPNPAHIKAFETLGANPTPMPFSEVYAALQTGTIDGQENPVNHIYASKLQEVQKYLSLTEHAYTAAPLVMNAMRFNSLSDEHKAALREAALEAAAFERQLNDEEEAGSLEGMRAAGMEIIEDPDREAFREAVADVTREAYVAEHGSELLDKAIAAAGD